MKMSLRNELQQENYSDIVRLRNEMTRKLLVKRGHIEGPALLM